MRIAKQGMFQRLHLISTAFFKTNTLLIMHADLLSNKLRARDREREGES